jgi:WD40 repeat protein
LSWATRSLVAPGRVCSYEWFIIALIFPSVSWIDFKSNFAFLLLIFALFPHSSIEHHLRRWFLLASASSDLTIRLWNIQDEQSLVSLAGSHGAVLAVAFSPDLRLVASASSDGTVRLWSVATVPSQP